MPVRLLDSYVIKWPNQKLVDKTVRNWSIDEINKHPDLVRLGYFGSYARGDWGVGSDLDLIAIVKESDLPFEQRAFSWQLTELPVPAELLVYTQDEWQNLEAEANNFIKMINQETVWVYSCDIK